MTITAIPHEQSALAVTGPQHPSLQPGASCILATSPRATQDRRQVEVAWLDATSPEQKNATLVLP